MTIRKGEPWGVEVPRPTGLTVVPDDRAAAATVEPVGLAGGDLFRSLGSPVPRDPVQRVPIDGLDVRLDGGAEQSAIAHVIVRRSWWRGTVVACMNVDRVGEWNVAPRAHPNDGLVDVIECSPAMSVRDRWAAKRRLLQGTHLPHPALAVARVAHRSWTFDRPYRVWIDGVEVGSAHHVDVRVAPDRHTVLF